MRAKRFALIPTKERKAQEKEAKRKAKADPKAHIAAFKAKQQQPQSAAVESPCAEVNGGPLLGSACGENPLPWPDTQPLPLLVTEAVNAFLCGKSSAEELQGLLSAWDYTASVKLDGTNVGLELLPPDERAANASLVGRRFRISPTARDYCHTSLEQVQALDGGALLTGLRAELPGGARLALEGATLYGELIVSDMLVYDYKQEHGSGRWLAFGLMLNVGSKEAALALESELEREGWAASRALPSGHVRVALNGRLRDVLQRLGVPAAPLQREGSGGLCALVEGEGEWMREMRGEGLIVTLRPPGRPARIAKWKVSAERQAACVAALTALDARLAGSAPDGAAAGADGRGADGRSAREKLCEACGEPFAAQAAWLVRRLLEVATAPLSLYFQSTTMVALPNKYSHKAMVAAPRQGGDALPNGTGDASTAPSGSGGPDDEPDDDEWEAQAHCALHSALTKLDALDAYFSAGEPPARVAAALLAEMRSDIVCRDAEEEARLGEYARAHVESAEKAWRHTLACVHACVSLTAAAGA